MITDPDFKAKIDLDHQFPAVAIDFETYYESKGASIKTMGVWAYLRHPQVQAYLVTIYDGENCFTGHPADFDWTSLDGRLLVSHNAAFDKAVYDRLVELGTIEPCNFAEWNCTASLSVYLKGPRDLKGAMMQLYGKHVSKDYRRQADGRTPEQMKEEGSWDNIVESNRNDTVDTWTLWTDNVHKWPYMERRLSVMTYEQSHRGMPLNLPLIRKNLKTLAEQKLKSVRAIPWADGDSEEGITSTKRMKAACVEAGVPPPITVSEDRPEFIEWEKKWGGKFPYISEMRNWRKCNLLDKKLQTMLGRADPKTGRFSYPQKYFGGHTGRWSGGSKDGTGETGFNPQNFNRESLHGVDLRKTINAEKGRKLIIADAAQIEPRSLAWLADDQDKLVLMRNGMSVYEIHGRQTMNWTGGDMKKEDKSMYQLAKVRVLGLGYGCGHVKFQVVAETQYDYIMDLRTARAQVKDFRLKERHIVRLWNKLGNAMMDTCQANERTWRADPDMHYVLPNGEKVKAHYVVLPSERPLIYLNPRIGNKNKHFADKAAKKKSKKASEADASKLVKSSDHEGLEAEDMMANLELGSNAPRFFYGGMLAENLVQATARDVFGEMLLRVEDTFGRFAPILFTSHDEMILDADPGISPKEVEEVMAIAPDWMSDCPFGAEAIESDFYMK